MFEQKSAYSNSSSLQNTVIQKEVIMLRATTYIVREATALSATSVFIAL